MSKASICFYLETRKKNQKTGKTPIYLRIINNKGKAETRLSLDVNEHELPFWNPRSMRMDDHKSFINKLLNKYQLEFEDILYRNNSKLNELTAKDLRDMLLGVKKPKRNLTMEYLWEYYNHSLLNKSTIENGTKKNYKKAITHFEKFLKHINKTELDLLDFNSAISNEFKDYLLANKPMLNKKGMTESSAAGNIKKLKTILERAVEDNKISKNPFLGIKLKTQSRYREKLNSHEIKTIQQFNFAEFPTLDKVRDIFMFSVFTGLAYNDAISLKKDQLQLWKDNEKYIHLTRMKTDIETRQFLVEQAYAIIEKHKSKMTFSDTLLPHISNQQLNMRLKIIADKAGISKPLTSHIARHSYRQLLSEAGIKDLAAIKTMMGHSRNRDIDAVYHSVTEKQLLDAKLQFQLFLNNLFK